MQHEAGEGRKREIILEEEPFEKSITFHPSEEERLSRSICPWVTQHRELLLYLLHLLRRHFILFPGDAFNTDRISRSDGQILASLVSLQTFFL